MMVRAVLLPLVILVPAALAWQAPRAAAAPAREGQNAPRQERLTPRPPLKGVHPPIAKPGDAACVECHRPMFSRKVLHGPVAAGACSSCHTVGAAGGRTRVGLKRGATPNHATALCITCHEDIGETLSLKHLHAPVQSGACTTCHDPHGSDFAFQLPAGGRDTCLLCHAEVAESVGQKYPHAPAARSCTVCHDPHGGRHPAQIRQALNQLCLTCHHDPPASDPTSSDDPELLFGRTATADERALAGAGRRIALDPGMKTGHPTATHPVAGPSSLVERDRPLTCASCHQPHGAITKKLLRFNAAGVSLLCVRCHKF